MSKGIMQQIRESEVTTLDGKFTKKDLEELSYKIQESAKKDYKLKLSFQEIYPNLIF